MLPGIEIESSAEYPLKAFFPRYVILSCKIIS